MTDQLKTTQVTTNSTAKPGILKPILITIGCLTLAVLMVVFGRKEAEKEPIELLPFVEVQEIASQVNQVVYDATGTVKPAKEVVLMPEVGGKIVWTSPKLIAGAPVKKGQALARIDSRDYQLAVEQIKSQVKAADIELQREMARGEIAERQWTLSGEEGTPSALASRSLQLESAKINVESAQSALKQAELRLNRTTIYAPFNAVITSENIEVGQVVGPSTQIAHLVGNQTLHLDVAVPVQLISRIQIKSGKKNGSQVRIIQNLGNGSKIEAFGHVEYISGVLDPQTRRVNLTVVIPRDKSLEVNTIPILPGSFVDVEVLGENVENTIAIPRKAIQNGNQVWVLNKDNTIQSMDLDILWSRKDFVYAKYENPSLRIITSPLSAPVNGLKVKTESGKSTSKKQTKAKAKGE